MLLQFVCICVHLSSRHGFQIIIPDYGSSTLILAVTALWACLPLTGTTVWQAMKVGHAAAALKDGASMWVLASKLLWSSSNLLQHCCILQLHLSVSNKRITFSAYIKVCWVMFVTDRWRSHALLMIFPFVIDWFNILHHCYSLRNLAYV